MVDTVPRSAARARGIGRAPRNAKVTFQVTQEERAAIIAGRKRMRMTSLSSFIRRHLLNERKLDEVLQAHRRGN